MKLYYISQQFKYEGAQFLLQGNDPEKERKLNLALEKGEIPAQKTYVFAPDSSYPKLASAVGTSDILETICTPMLFSKKLVLLLADCADFRFFPVCIKTPRGENHDYFLAKIQHQLDCVDLEKSQNLGDFFQEKLAILSHKIPEQIYAFSFADQDSHTLAGQDCYTQKFIDLIEKHQLETDFYPYDFIYLP